MSTTSEKERQKFYAKIVSLPQMVAAEVNRDEVVSWYKRARKKTRTTDDPNDGSRSNDGMMMSSLDGSLMNGGQSMLNDHHMMGGLDHSHLLVNSSQMHNGMMHSHDMSHLMGSRMNTLDAPGLGLVDLSLQNNNRPVREMAPEELAYAEPSSAAAYAAALSAQQHAQSSLGQSMPPPPIVAPVAATQPVVGL
jgi:hypothetical protein